MVESVSVLVVNVEKTIDVVDMDDATMVHPNILDTATVGIVIVETNKVDTGRVGTTSVEMIVVEVVTVVPITVE